MARTVRPNAITDTAAGDGAGESIRRRVWALIWPAPTAAGVLTVKNGTGTVILDITSAAVSPIVIYWPFGLEATVDGVETDALTGGPVTYVLA